MNANNGKAPKRNRNVTASRVSRQLDDVETIGPSANDSAPARRSTVAPVMVRLSDVQAEPIEWLWPSRIAMGKITILAGDPGLGKSFITCDLAARVSTGDGWPDDELSDTAKGSVVMLNCEDGLADTVRPRLDAHSADVSKIIALSAVRDPRSGDAERPFDLARDLPALEAAIVASGDCKLVVIDPVTAYLGAKTDSHKAADVRALLAPLAMLAVRHRVAVVAVSHLNKGNGPAMYRIMGSVAFGAAARSVWCVSKDKQNPQRRLFLPIKNNLGNDATGLAYSIVDGVVMWESGIVATTADEALTDESRRRGPEPKERNAAHQFLRDALSTGPQLAKKLIDEAVQARGIAPRTLNRAKAELSIEAFRETKTGRWWWRLPNDDDEADPLPPIEFGNLGNVGRSTRKKDVRR